MAKATKPPKKTKRKESVAMEEGNKDGQNEAVTVKLAAQVAAHERDIANLTSAVTSLSETMQATGEAQWKAIREQGDSLRGAIVAQGAETRRDLTTLANKFSESRATSWPLIVSLVAAGVTMTGLAVTVLSLIGSMALEPIRDRLDEHISDGHPNRVEKQVTELRASTGERFGEIETQFQGMQTRSNLIDQQAYILLNLTRKEAGLEPLDMPTYWPRPFMGAPPLNHINSK